MLLLFSPGNGKDISGNRKTVYGGDANECYRKNFAGNLPPVGLRDPMNFFIRLPGRWNPLWNNVRQAIWNSGILGLHSHGR